MFVPMSSSTGEDQHYGSPFFGLNQYGVIGMDQLEFFVGVDWGSRDHQICVVDMEGKVCAQRSFKHCGMGLTAMADWIVRTTQSSPYKVGVAIETPRGPVVESLMGREFDEMVSPHFTSAKKSAMLRVFKSNQPCGGSPNMNRMNNTTIGLDIAKNVFHYAELNRNGRVTGSGMLKRNKVLSHFAGLESAKVVMEACAGSHYWGQQLQECGHEVILLPAHKVTPYVQGSKNDKNDSIAIAEASGRPGIRAVAVKTVEQQNMMMLHSIRQQAVQQRTQKRNALRAHLSERGLTARCGKSALYALIESVITPDEDGVIGTSCEVDGLFVSMLAKEYQNLPKLEQEVEDYDTRIKVLVNGSEPMRRLMEIPGFGRSQRAVLRQLSVMARYSSVDGWCRHGWD